MPKHPMLPLLPLPFRPHHTIITCTGFERSWWPPHHTPRGVRWLSTQCRRPGWLADIRLQMPSEGLHVSGTVFIAKNALFPNEIWLLGAFFGFIAGGPKNDPGEHHRLYFLTSAEDALLMFFGASATPKDPHKSAHHEHQRVGSWVLDAAASLENAENAVNTVVFVLLRTVRFEAGICPHKPRMPGGRSR